MLTWSRAVGRLTVSWYARLSMWGLRRFRWSDPPQSFVVLDVGPLEFAVEVQ